MTEVQFNKAGIPLMAFGKNTFITTTGAPRGKANSQNKKPPTSTQTTIVEDKTTVDGYEIANWGPANDFPKTANDTIRTVGVLNTGLKFIRNFTIGQGLFPCRVIGYDTDGNELLQVIDNPEIIEFCNSRLVRRYLEKLLRDYLKFGVGNVQLIPNDEGTKMVGLHTINALNCRYTIAKKGTIEKAIISGKWPDTPSKGEYEAIDLLDEYDPAADLFRRKQANEVKGKSFVYAVRDSWSNADYYSEPIWLSAYLSGWVDIARSIPAFLKKAYQNQITWKWHVQIPYVFWDKKFPKEEFENNKAREDTINQYLDKIEENLTGQENADKAIFTFFEINPANGKVEEQWIITALDNKYKENDKLITSAAANSEILFSLMLNPNVLGAGMPGGTYAGNQGGSNIREAFLVNIANAWLDRHNILDPLETFLYFNGVRDVQLRFRSTILTTLDTGAGTKRTLS